MGMGFAPTWLRLVSPLLHKTTLTTGLATTPQCEGHITYKRTELRKICMLTRGYKNTRK